MLFPSLNLNTQVVAGHCRQHVACGLGQRVGGARGEGGSGSGFGVCSSSRTFGFTSKIVGELFGVGKSKMFRIRACDYDLGTTSS